MKLICIGRNYVDHIKELSHQRDEEPLVFFKPDTAILPKKQDFFIPDFSNDIQHEIELLVRINKVGKHIDKKFAPKYYGELGLGIDFTARDVQADCISKGLPWEKSKGFDGSAVIGKWVDKNIFKDLNNISFRLDKNGKTVQQSNTQMMLWKIDELVAYVSQFFTLKIGDIIFTGTPAGVSKVVPDDKLTGYLEGQQLLSVKIK